MAQSFIECITIRENNDYCHQAMLHGHDMKKHLMQKTPSIKEFSEKEKAELDAIMNKLVNE